MSKKKLALAGEAVLKILSENQTFMAQSPAMIAAQTEFILRIDEILGEDRLSKSVSFGSLIEANVHFHKYALENGMAEKIADEMKKSQEVMKQQAVNMKDTMVSELGGLGNLFGMFFTDEVIGSLANIVSDLKTQLSDTIASFDEILKDPDKFLKDQGGTELQGLIWIGLSPSLAKQCTKKTDLTIAELLLLEPGTIVNYPGSPAQPSKAKTSKKK